jgi:hypothetical protein
MSFNTLLANARSSLRKNNYTDQLWVPEFGWSPSEALASEDPHDPQMLAALQIFRWCYIDEIATPDKRVWVHLAAEMQAGKTGVVTTLLRLCLANRSLQLDPRRLFILTGMSDEAWQRQTEERMPEALRPNVHHGSTLLKAKAKLEALAEASPDRMLSNVMITLDESHHAAAASNQPAKYIYDTVAALCPIELWQERGIRFLTISATDPAKVLAMQVSEKPTAVVRLLTTPAYQSVESLKAAKRVIPIAHGVHEPKGMEELKKKVDALESVHGHLIHIIRPSQKACKEIESLLKANFPACNVVPWDMESKKLRKKGSETASTVSDDINVAHLNNKPQQTTFVILKGMFRAAKTLVDTHVGVLYDRVGGMDSTNLQSLLGRACGYGKSSRTIVFASGTTVDTYLRLWKELCANKHFASEVVDIPLGAVRRKMPGVAAVGNQPVALAPTLRTACPLGSGVREDRPAPQTRVVHDEDEFDVQWSEELLTPEEAQAITGGKKMRPNEDGYYANASGRKGPMTRDHLIAVRGGKKTAHGRPRAGQDKVYKTFAVYNDPLDASSVRFIVRTLVRRT